MSRMSFRVKLNSIVCMNVNEAGGCGFESRCCHLNKLSCSEFTYLIACKMINIFLGLNLDVNFLSKVTWSLKRNLRECIYYMEKSCFVLYSVLRCLTRNSCGHETWQTKRYSHAFPNVRVFWIYFFQSVHWLIKNSKHHQLKNNISHCIVILLES